MQRVKISINHILGLVLIYPLLLFFPTLLGKEAFFITAPYFFFVFLFVFVWLVSSKNLFSSLIIDRVLLALFLLVVCAVFNFSFLRYSLPLFFTVYAFCFFLILKKIELKDIPYKALYYYFILFLTLSVPMIFLNAGYTVANRFVGFVGSPTIYSGFLVSFFIIVTYNFRITSLKFIVAFLVTFFLVYLTKTRLLLILILLYPLLRILIDKRAWASRKLLFIVFYLSTLLMYPLYSFVTYLFPSLVTLRYGNKKDSSFGLRNFLFEEMKNLFLEGDLTEKLFGRGNEFSRLYVQDLLEVDLMPHNDYMRILVDWGVFGFLVFSYLIYKVAIKNDLSFYLILVYMILFYSNTVFNLFLISMLLIFYHNTNISNRVLRC